MERVHVTSGLVISVGYDVDTSSMEIEFTTGRNYRYFNVPQSVYEDFIFSESHGRFFNSYIRDLYRCVEV